jgi:hypothetical protein
MSHQANHRALRCAILRLAANDCNETDVSNAIDAFGQVLADLTDTPLRLAVVSGEALETENELRAEVLRLKTLLNGNYGITFAGFKVVEDPSLAPNEIKAVCVNHDFQHGTCNRCGLVHWSE